jgi:AraC-like DNA-binding protein
VEFKPLTLSHLFNFKVSQSVDKIIDASALLGKKTKAYLLQQLSGLNKTEEIKKVFENYFKDSFQKSIAIDNNITSAINLLTISKGKEKLENIYNEISIGKRQFQRNFLNETGITLKDFARIIRVRSAADKVVEGVENPSDIIFESGFYDQSHYYKEFKVFSGVNPTIFAERQRKLTHQPK